MIYHNLYIVALHSTSNLLLSRAHIQGFCSAPLRFEGRHMEYLPTELAQKMASSEGCACCWRDRNRSNYVNELAESHRRCFCAEVEYCGGGATLTWNANAEPHLAGYRIYQCSLLPCAASSGNLLVFCPGLHFVL
jgi:hypothetical protein